MITEGGFFINKIMNKISCFLNRNIYIILNQYKLTQSSPERSKRIKYILFFAIAMFLLVPPVNVTKAANGEELAITAMYATNFHWKSHKQLEYDFTLVIEYEVEPNTSSLSPGCCMWSRAEGQSWLYLGYGAPATKVYLVSEQN